MTGDWGLGTGDWGLVTGDWGLVTGDWDLKEIVEFAQKHDLWLIEDNCDALGSLYQGQKTGTFRHIATVSFYPAHHITMGEGGAVLSNDPKLKKIVESFRDWVEVVGVFQE